MGMKTKIFMLLILAFLLASCAKSDPGGAAVVAYLKAIAANDQNGAQAVSCADWQSQASDEVAAFAGVKARLNNLACKTVSSAGNQSTVECTGGIIGTYVDKEQTFDMSGRQFKVVQEQGKWLVCGYGQ